MYAYLSADQLGILVRAAPHFGIVTANGEVRSTFTKSGTGMIVGLDCLVDREHYIVRCTITPEMSDREAAAECIGIAADMSHFQDGIRARRDRIA